MAIQVYLLNRGRTSIIADPSRFCPCQVAGCCAFASVAFRPIPQIRIRLVEATVRAPDQKCVDGLLLNPIPTGRFVVHDDFRMVQALVNHVLKVAAVALVSSFGDLLRQVFAGKALLALGENSLDDRPQ